MLKCFDFVYRIIVEFIFLVTNRLSITFWTVQCNTSIYDFRQNVMRNIRRAYILCFSEMLNTRFCRHVLISWLWYINLYSFWFFVFIEFCILKLVADVSVMCNLIFAKLHITVGFNSFCQWAIHLVAVYSIIINKYAFPESCGKLITAVFWWYSHKHLTF